jgi:carbonic anhydrase/acetyltransferase-like protein (isoleucine patch superfamily)
VSSRQFGQLTPQIHSSAFVDETALVIGQAVLDEDCSIWPMAVVRADINAIAIGKRSNVQDGTIIHVTHAGKFNPEGYATVIGNDVTVGHRCILHGCTIGDRCLVGMGVCLMDGVTVESNVIIGAGSLVTPGKTLTSGYLWLGSPARRARPLTDQELEFLGYSANYYVQLKNQHSIVISPKF